MVPQPEFVPPRAIRPERDVRPQPRFDGRRSSDRHTDFAARARARCLRRCLDDLGERPKTMVTLGWQHGTTNAEFFARLHIQSLTTIDVAAARPRAGSLKSADGKATYIHVSDFRATESTDLAYTHGVLDRMSSVERTAAAVLVYRSLKSGGLFSVWHANPWAPWVAVKGSRLSSRERALAMTPPEARRLLRGVGFDVLQTVSAFFFPPSLGWCQPIESLLSPIPLGSEYMVLARKP